MGTKMKGLLKGLRYISQIFDDEKEPEMQIGFPTDVKHVAHIGWDGPSVDSPSWMKEFNAQQAIQSAPLNINGEPKENPEIKWVSEDSSRKSTRSQNSPANGLSEVPRSSRRQSNPDGSLTSESPTRESSTKARQSRRHQSTHSSKDSSSNSSKQNSSLGSDSTSRNLPDIPKKSRRKKSKESINGGGSSRPSRSKPMAQSTYTSPFSDPGSEMGSLTITKSEFCQSSSLKPLVEKGENGHNGIS